MASDLVVIALCQWKPYTFIQIWAEGSLRHAFVGDSLYWDDPFHWGIPDLTIGVRPLGAQGVTWHCKTSNQFRHQSETCSKQKDIKKLIGISQHVIKSIEELKIYLEIVKSYNA